MLYKTILINLKREKERLEFMTNQLNGLKILFERLEAINGKEYLENGGNEYDEESALKNHYSKLTNGEIGCALSHKRCYQKFLNDPEYKNTKYLLILEDDVELDKNFKDSSVKSLSCMHVIEHIGLGRFGRYGDNIDNEGDIKAINELKRVCDIGGSILFVVPVGEERIQFNAHRIYSFETIKKIFEEGFELKEFSLITDKNEYIENINIKDAKNLVEKQRYGCGCFYFIKK